MFAWCCGRGFGKTRIGAEHVNSLQEFPALVAGRIAIVGKTRDDARDTMVLGESGIAAVAEARKIRLVYKPTRRLLIWPDSGCRGFVHSADAAGRIRGPQFGAAWGDEIGEWDDPEAWTNLDFAVRLGQYPHTIATFTPKPTPLVRTVLEDPDTAVTTGRSAENAANMAPGKYDKLLRTYGGTHLGEQELNARIIDARAGAYWRPSMIEPYRLRQAPRGVFRRIVLAIDPSGSDAATSAETGIVVAAIDYQDPPHVYVLADASCDPTTSPHGWACRVRDEWRLWRCDRVVAEINYGGALVATNLRTVDPAIPIRTIHARQGKAARAEPVAALYEQGRVHHVGIFPELERQQTEWIPGTKSPDRLDALVYAVTDLAIDEDEDDAGDASAYLGTRAR